MSVEGEGSDSSVNQGGKIYNFKSLCMHAHI